MPRSRIIIATFTSLTLILSPCVSFADPGNGNGPDNGKPQSSQAKGHNNPSGGKHDPSHNSRHNAPSVDRGHVLGIIGGHRDYWSPGKPLPPGTQKKLVRGKPLPPGIAKKLDGRLLGQLPQYDGYEWRQVGVDLVLVAVATGIIYEVLNGALD